MADQEGKFVLYSRCITIYAPVEWDDEKSEEVMNQFLPSVSSHLQLAGDAAMALNPELVAELSE